MNDKMYATRVSNNLSTQKGETLLYYTTSDSGYQGGLGIESPYKVHTAGWGGGG